MPNALLLVQQNVRYVKNIAFVNVVSSFLFFFFSILQNILECSSSFVVSPTFWLYGIYDVIRIMNVVLALQAALFVLILIPLSYQKAF